MRQQEALQPAIEALQAEVDREPNSGFVSLAFEGDGVGIYWKGDLTAGMMKALAIARQFGGVTIRPAPFSRAELRDGRR